MSLGNVQERVEVSFVPMVQKRPTFQTETNRSLLIHMMRTFYHHFFMSEMALPPAVRPHQAQLSSARPTSPGLPGAPPWAVGRLHNGAPSARCHRRIGRLLQAQ